MIVNVLCISIHVNAILHGAIQQLLLFDDYHVTILDVVSKFTTKKYRYPLRL